MPPRRKAAVDAEEKKRKRAEAARARRASESADARAARLAKARASHAKKTGEAREARLAQMRAYRARQERRDVPQRLDALERNRVAQHRRVAAETSEKYNERLLRCRTAKQIRWASMSEEERQAELAHRRELQRTRYLLMPARERAHLLDRMRAAARARRAAATSNADPAAPRTARCVVPVCHSRSAPSSILYPLPAEPSQRQAWIDFVRGCPCGDACDWNPPTNEISFVCSLHFTVRCFRFQRPRGGSAGYRKRLKRGAVPTLYPIEEQCSSTANKNSLDNTAERLHEIKDTVQVTRAQCGGCHVLQQSNSSSPGTSPPSVAWKWPQRLPAVLSGLCPSQCSAVGEWRSSSEILRTESRSQPCVCAPRHYNRPKCLSDCAVLLL
ncbi:uncharacterized protein [Dermacentor andersoni]|uniref:uncharacterized protein isoform X1 n=1 Tax=Dermacentor andersoni TaxID=34620 RepID=UPI00241708AA|nr:uncharacterized protein LOC126526730 isoform X1 [Dermacentor andersoni]